MAAHKIEPVQCCLDVQAHLSTHCPFHSLSATMRPKPFLISQFQKPDPPRPDRKDERNSSRSKLRDCFDTQLGQWCYVLHVQRRDSHTDTTPTIVQLTGRSDAKMWYATLPYGKWVVNRFGYKFNDGGWPSDIPFRDLNRIPGGTHTLRRLQSRWDNGLLRLVRATDEDKCNACLDPRLLIPNAAQRAAALGVSIPRAPAKLVYHITDLASRFQLPGPASSPTTGIVLHPATMNPHFTFSVLPTGAPNASDARRPERSQRSDINKSRKRPVTNPEGRELRHPKRGPTTTKCVVEAEGITADEVDEALKSQRILLTDEILTDCVEVGKGASGSCGDHQSAEKGFSDSEPEDDIESADNWDM